MQKFATPALSSLLGPDYTHPINPHSQNPHLRRTRKFPTTLHAPRPFKPQTFKPLLSLCNELHHADLRRGDAVSGISEPANEIRRSSGELLWRYEPREACELSEEEAREVRTRLDVERARGKKEFITVTMREFYARRQGMVGYTVLEDENTAVATVAGGDAPASTLQDENDIARKVRGTRRFWHRKETESLQSSASSVRSLASFKDSLKARLFRVRTGNVLHEVQEEQASSEQTPPTRLTRKITNAVRPIARKASAANLASKLPMSGTHNLNPFAKKKVWSSGKRFNISDEELAPLVSKMENMKVVDKEALGENGTMPTGTTTGSMRKGWFGRRTASLRTMDMGGRLRR